MMTIMLSLLFSFMLIKLIKMNMFKFFQLYIMLNLFLFLIFNKILFFMHKFYWMMHMDYLSFYLILITIWIISLMFLITTKMNFNQIYSINLLIMLIIIMLTFFSVNYFMFYLYFEISMIPTLLLIMGWGGQYERIEASLYMILYTMFASLPLMIILIKIYYNVYSTNMILLNNMNLINNMYMYIYLLLTFLIKMPMFFFHLWLPKAHVEAPITGSMILAAIMLKLGSYGMLRIMLIMEKICMKLNLFIMTFSILGATYISIICFQQTDLKMMIAYSSVVHMNMLIPSLLTLNSWAFKGSIIMMISHALASSALFLLVNMNYTRLFSRSLLINKGMMNVIPSLSMFWFLMAIFNSSAPPSLNLFSEIFMINSILFFNNLFMIFIMILAMTNLIYMLFMFSFSQHGIIYKNMNPFMFINMMEFLIMFLHLIPILILILMF